MNILVTGGAGFIGSNFVRSLAQTKNKIINLDLLTYSGRMENLQDLRTNKNHIFIKGDIRNARLIDKVIKKYKIDVIFNFAAETHVDRSLVFADSFISTDVYGSYALLEAARLNKVKDFVQVSTDEVYGSADEKHAFKEDDRLSPSSPYSASKAAADLLVLSYYKSHDMNVKISRSSNNYGPFQFPEKLISKMIIRALKDEHIPIYGKGQQRRNWIHVQDNCDGIFTVYKQGKGGEIYNISTSDEYSNLDVAKMVVKYLGKNESIIRFVEDRPGHDYRYSIDSGKIMSLGWKPQSKLKSALPSVIEWYRNNTWWWKPLLRDRFVKLDTPWKQ